ncbi:MAG: hypothetical protein KDB00_28725 [Planctomycetales bacterium]|nr:hypothetical protein [Planctomycetales bacterium]
MRIGLMMFVLVLCVAQHGSGAEDSGLFAEYRARLAQRRANALEIRRSRQQTQNRVQPTYPYPALRGYVPQPALRGYVPQPALRGYVPQPALRGYVPQPALRGYVPQPALRGYVPQPALRGYVPQPALRGYTPQPAQSFQ